MDKRVQIIIEMDFISEEEFLHSYFYHNFISPTLMHNKVIDFMIKEV